nr:AAA family ATPase [uncultured Fluviicola sp.]
MLFFTPNDLETLNKYVGKSKRDIAEQEFNDVYDYLKNVYQKVKYWADELNKNAFNGRGVVSINRRPTNRVGNFDSYLWAQVYPNTDSPSQIAYTIEINNESGFLIKIDTIRQGNNEIRQKYDVYRGDYYNSPIILHLDKNEILNKDWNYLLNISEDFIKQTINYYYELLNTTGLKAIVDKSKITLKEDIDHFPINQILYGPPGTGKTHRLKSEYFPKYTTKETSITSEQHFEEVVRELTWWQVIAIAVIELGKCKVGDILKHKWVIQKAKLSNSNTVRPTVWGQLQSHTVESCEYVNVKAKQQPFIFNKSEDSYWEILDEEVKELVPELYEIIESVNNFLPNPEKEIKRYVFTTFHQSFNYEDFIEGIKPILNDGQESEQLIYKIEDGIFKELCKRAESDPNNQYAIFIDEINRGNVSAIFGELITLIETDKRKDGEHPMSAKLPYSKKSFTVPSNVDIIGTMNTADRSVEALDTALRRRFSFVEMLPEPELLENNTIEGLNLATLLKTINERIEILVDRDHTIGHAFFINDKSIDDLKHTFKNKIIPLLQEYFYGNYQKMALVLGSSFFKITEQKSVVFAEKTTDYDFSGKVYTIHDCTNENFNFIEALHKLMNNTTSQLSQTATDSDYVKN